MSCDIFHCIINLFSGYGSTRDRHDSRGDDRREGGRGGYGGGRGGFGGRDDSSRKLFCYFQQHGFYVLV